MGARSSSRGLEVKIVISQWWSFFFPGLVIALWALGFYLLGDGIRDILDPKQRN